MTSAKDKREFRRFSDMADRLLSVPHEEIKEKLEAEKKAKKRKKSKRTTAGDKHDARA